MIEPPTRGHAPVPYGPLCATDLQMLVQLRDNLLAGQRHAAGLRVRREAWNLDRVFSLQVPHPSQPGSSPRINRLSARKLPLRGRGVCRRQEVPQIPGVVGAGFGLLRRVPQDNSVNRV